MELTDKFACTGCGACIQICSHDAITVNADNSGFQYPEIDSNICVECGLCNRVCPAKNQPKMNIPLETYAAQANDKILLRESTSGGGFPVLATEIINRKGVVYGCVWDENYNAIFTKADCIEQIVPMKGSKYVWSYAGDSFSKIKIDLDFGRPVLFAGLPCQVAGLKGYLRKEYDNLYLIDFLCSGTPSPLAFHKYLETIASKEQLVGLNFKFRDKNPYGVGVHITYTGQKKKTSRRGEHIKNPYYYAFYRHYLDRLSCYKCPYGTSQRISDVTLGDYWGVEKYHTEMDTKSGVSALLVNSEKGAELIKSVADRLDLIPTKIESISKANNLLLEGRQRNRKIPDIREELFNVLRTNGWLAVEKKFLHNSDRFKQRLKLLIPLWVVRIVKKHAKNK